MATIATKQGPAAGAPPNALFLSMWPDLNPIVWWRVWRPLLALREQGAPVGCLSAQLHGEWVTHALGYDVVTIPQPAFRAGPALDTMKAWIGLLHANGGVAIADYADDCFDDHGRVASAAQAATGGVAARGASPPRTDRVATLALFDGVTCTTPALAAQLRDLTDRPVHVVPNLIPWGWFRDVLARAERETFAGEAPHVAGEDAPVVVGWVGGGRPVGDVEPMCAAWRRLAHTYGPARVRFVVGGVNLGPFRWGFPAGCAPHWRGWSAIERYPGLYRHLDIGCAPAEASVFNRHKSAIRALEYAAAGCAVVAAPVPYGALVRDRENGLLAQTEAEWYAALARLIEGAPLRRRLAAALAAEAQRDWSLERHAGRWSAAWTALVGEARARRVGQSPPDVAALEAALVAGAAALGVLPAGFAAAAGEAR